MVQTKYTPLIKELRRKAEQDQVSSQDLYRAIGVIEQLQNRVLQDYASFNMMVDDVDEMNRIGAGVNAATIKRFLNLQE